MRFFPLGHKVYLRPLLPPSQTASGLEVVRAYQPVVMGVVVATGPAVTSVVVGETVVFSDSVGQEIRVEGESMLLLDEQVLAAVVAADPVTCPYCCRALEEATHG